MFVFNLEGKKFLGGEGGNWVCEFKEIGVKNFLLYCDVEVGYVWFLICVIDILVK